MRLSVLQAHTVLYLRALCHCYALRLIVCLSLVGYQDALDSAHHPTKVPVHTVDTSIYMYIVYKYYDLPSNVSSKPIVHLINTT